MDTAVWEQPKDDAGHQADSLSPDDREFVITKLAEMLVNAYQQSQPNQEVMEGTVKEPSGFYRKTGRCHQTPDPYAQRQPVRSIGQFIST